MDYLKGLISRIKERRSPVALKYSVLDRLPLELLFCIIDHLPRASAASFSLSCLRIKRLVGSQYIQKLAGSTVDILALLNLLERDLPDQIACFSCIKLHEMKNASRYIESSRRYWVPEVPACLTRDRNTSISFYISSNFSTAVFQMAMKVHSQNHQNSKLLRLLSTSKKVTDRGRYMIKSIAEKVRIVNGALFFRKQIAFQILIKSSPISWDFWVQICPHLRYNTSKHSAYVRMYHPAPFERIWEEALHFHDKMGIERYDMSSGVMRCHYCRTEYQIDFKHSVDHDTMVFCTLWKDFGAGPDDEIWKAHIKPQNWRSIPPTVSFNVGEISSVFQQGEPFLFDSILPPRRRIWGF